MERKKLSPLPHLQPTLLLQLPAPPSLSSAADGSSVTSSYCCLCAGRNISNKCSFHTSGSMHLPALSLNYSSDHTIPLWHDLMLSSVPSAKAEFPSITCRERASSTFPLLPDYPLHLLSFAELWCIYLALQPPAVFLSSGRNSICKSLLQYTFFPTPTSLPPNPVYQESHLLLADCPKRRKGAC